MPYKDPIKRSTYHKEYGATWRKENQLRIKHKNKIYYDKTSTLTNTRFIKLKSTAKKRKLILNITLEQYSLLISIPCIYCSGAFETNSTGVGLDRVDNNRGYEFDNVVSCCGECNRIKGSKLSKEEAKAAIKAIIEVREWHLQNFNEIK